MKLRRSGVDVVGLRSAVFCTRTLVVCSLAVTV